MHLRLALVLFLVIDLQLLLHRMLLGRYLDTLGTDLIVVIAMILLCIGLGFTSLSVRGMTINLAHRA